MIKKLKKQWKLLNEFENSGSPFSEQRSSFCMEHDIKPTELEKLYKDFIKLINFLSLSAITSFITFLAYYLYTITFTSSFIIFIFLAYGLFIMFKGFKNDIISLGVFTLFNIFLLILTWVI